MSELENEAVPELDPPDRTPDRTKESASEDSPDRGAPENTPRDGIPDPEAADATDPHAPDPATPESAPSAETDAADDANAVEPASPEADGIPEPLSYVGHSSPDYQRGAYFDHKVDDWGPDEDSEEKRNLELAMNIADAAEGLIQPLEDASNDLDDLPSIEPASAADPECTEAIDPPTMSQTAEHPKDQDYYPTDTPQPSVTDPALTFALGGWAIAKGLSRFRGRGDEPGDDQGQEQSED